MATLRVGLVQLARDALDVERNAERTVEAVGNAAAGGARVVLLPELAGSVLIDPFGDDVGPPGPRPAEGDS